MRVKATTFRIDGFHCVATEFLNVGLIFCSNGTLGTGCIDRAHCNDCANKATNQTFFIINPSPINLKSKDTKIGFINQRAREKPSGQLHWLCWHRMTQISFLSVMAELA
jgi:hypothetical protein